MSCVLWLTHQYAIYLTVCLWAITNHPRNGCQCVRVELEPGQKWSKTAEERGGGGYLVPITFNHGKLAKCKAREIFTMRTGDQMSRHFWLDRADRKINARILEIMLFVSGVCWGHSDFNYNLLFYKLEYKIYTCKRGVKKQKQIACGTTLDVTCSDVIWVQQCLAFALQFLIAVTLKGSNTGLCALVTVWWLHAT